MQAIRKEFGLIYIYFIGQQGKPYIKAFDWLNLIAYDITCAHDQLNLTYYIEQQEKNQTNNYVTVFTIYHFAQNIKNIILCNVHGKEYMIVNRKNIYLRTFIKMYARSTQFNLLEMEQLIIKFLAFVIEAFRDMNMFLFPDDARRHHRVNSGWCTEVSIGHLQINTMVMMIQLQVSEKPPHIVPLWSKNIFILSFYPLK